jgi:hypothetical protein
MDRETLAQLTRRRLDELGLGMREAARTTQGINAQDISQIVRGRQVSIGDDKARALARALRVPVVQVYDAREYSRLTKPLELPGRLNFLDENLRRALVNVGDYLLRLQEHGASGPAETADKTARREGVGRRRR